MRGECRAHGSGPRAACDESLDTGNLLCPTASSCAAPHAHNYRKFNPLPGPLFHCAAYLPPYRSPAGMHHLRPWREAGALLSCSSSDGFLTCSTHARVRGGDRGRSGKHRCHTSQLTDTPPRKGLSASAWRCIAL